MAKLEDYRIRGVTGKKNDWLENIHPENVIGIVTHTLKRMEKEGRTSIHSLGINP